MQNRKGAGRRVFFMGIICIILSAVLLASPKISDSIADKIAYEKTETVDEMKKNIQKGSCDEERQNEEPDRDGYLTLEKNDYPVIYEEDIERLKSDSEKYNEGLRRHQVLSDFEKAALNLEDYGIFTGIYGYVEIERISLRLPIYLGADDSSMASGAAHLYSTSLPIGGKGTNCVLAGHTAYTGMTFFDDLPKLEKGDEVKIVNWFDTLIYAVGEYRTVPPGASNECYISQNRDLLTLMTCANRGENRYMVICERKK